MKRMKTTMIAALVALATLSVAGISAADDWRADRGLHGRGEWQMHDGRFGSGLTPSERARIRRARRHVRMLEMRAMADGRITYWERRRIAIARLHLRQLVLRLRNDDDRGGWGVY